MKTVSDFIKATGLCRGARKITVDNLIRNYGITDSDLIADIYGFLGI